MEGSNHSAAPGRSFDDGRTASGAIAFGGLIGAVASTSCCIVPLVLFSLGIGGAWIGTLTALAPYQPIFAVVTLGFLGSGYYLTRRTTQDCEGGACARPLPSRLVKATLWVATVLVTSAIIFPYLAPSLLAA
ncbi:mercuric transporter MerT family protein [Lutibaculum baratangense]|uniref:Mercuric transport protein MerT n=1 Tax=Lutibaculum baratangense AMV1 TaxID=631454 RepID=V4REP9_9HYPH|nr:mercuric transporter MerT family protein [Lutibaculum baratangense]ESR24616.1 mercuric transport protein MerT [Lutibaculum baratangense AMV1]